MVKASISAFADTHISMAFLNKFVTFQGFGTTISPWIVTLDALAPFACKPWHDHTNTEFEHQRHPDLSKATFDINLDVALVRKFDFV